MDWVDFTIAASIFLIFLTLIFILVTNHFLNAINTVRQSELKQIAINYFRYILDQEGVPRDWNEINEYPIQAGLSTNLYQIPIIAREDNYNRTKEIISLEINFDKSCTKSIKNSSVRVFDDSMNEIAYRLTNQDLCENNKLSNATLVFYDSIEKNEEKKYYIYYSSENFSQPNYTIESDMVGYWSFDEGSGDTAKDLTENNNVGTLEFSYWTEGKYGYAVDFDGSNSVTVENSNSLNPEEVSIEFWIKVIGSQEDKTIIEKEGSYGISFNKFGGKTLSAYTSNMNENCMPQSGSIDEDKWYHVVFTSDGTNHKLYINGSLENSTNCDAPIESNSNQLTIGTNSTKTNYFIGIIDDLRIYNRVLSEEEITTSYQSTPLTVLKFPENKVSMISVDRMEDIRKIDVDYLKQTLGEDYKFKIEVYHP